MEKYWYKGYEVLDLLHWRLEDLVQACELGLKVYDENISGITPILEIFRRRYDYSKVFRYRFNMNNYREIQEINVKITIKEQTKEYKLIKDEHNYFILDNKFFFLSISHKGYLYFERYNNIEIEDINSFLREYFNNEFIDIDNISLLSNPLFFSQKDDISNNEYIKLKIKHHYEKRKKLYQEFHDKCFVNEFKHNLNYDEDMKITIRCNIQLYDNSIEEQKIYIQILGEENNIKNYIYNPFINYDFDGFVLNIFIPEKQYWFIAPSNDAINDILALRDENVRIEDVSETKLLSIYNEAYAYEKNEYIYTINNMLEGYNHLLNSYFNKDDIVKYLKLSSISIHITHNNSKVIKYCDKILKIENNSLIIKNKKSKLKQYIENYDNLKEYEKTYTQTNESVSNEDKYLLNEILPKGIYIDKENKEIVLKIYKFLENFKSHYQDENILKSIDILKYKTLCFTNEEIANKLHINKNYNAVKTHISRAIKKALEEINKKYNFKFPYIQHNNINEYINNNRNIIHAFFQNIK